MVGCWFLRKVGRDTPPCLMFVLNLLTPISGLTAVSSFLTLLMIGLLSVFLIFGCVFGLLEPRINIQDYKLALKVKQDA
jgi:uncharacterized membrane-anchored protein YitT (DUF2179 family)